MIGFSPNLAFNVKHTWHLTFCIFILFEFRLILLDRITYYAGFGCRFFPWCIAGNWTFSSDHMRHTLFRFVNMAKPQEPGLLQLNASKCKCMHMSSDSPLTSYILNDDYYLLVLYGWYSIRVRGNSNWKRWKGSVLIIMGLKYVTLRFLHGQCKNS